MHVAGVESLIVNRFRSRAAGVPSPSTGGAQDWAAYEAMSTSTKIHTRERHFGSRTKHQRCFGRYLNTHPIIYSPFAEWLGAVAPDHKVAGSSFIFDRISHLLLGSLEFAEQSPKRSSRSSAMDF